MMRKPNNWENVKAAAERLQLPKGAYICKIMNAEVKQYDGRNGKFERLEISIDITEGEQKDFFANDYRSQPYEDKKWRGIFRLYVPRDDGSEKDEWTKSKFKAATDAIEDSNSGYRWDWNEAGLKGKMVGCLFGLAEWEYNGNSGWKTEAVKFIPVENVRNGKFVLPKDRPLKASEISVNTLTASEEITDDDLPF